MHIRHSLARSFLSISVVLLFAPVMRAQSGVAGTYRCVSFNVGGRGGRCTSPPLVFQADGQYQMSSEHGTYSVRNNRIFLSESKIRGAGRLQGGNEIVFEYTYRGLPQTITYRREAEAAAPHSTSEPGETRFVPVSFTVEFSATDGSVDWINSANLVPEGGAKEDGYETLAVTDGKQTVTAYFRAVATGRIYTLLVGSGFETRALAKVDLRKATAPVKLTVRAPHPTQDRDRFTPPTSGSGSTLPRSDPDGHDGNASRPQQPSDMLGKPSPALPVSAAPTQNTVNSAPARAKPKCNPGLPRYSQGDCDEGNTNDLGGPPPCNDQAPAYTQVNCVPAGGAPRTQAPAVQKIGPECAESTPGQPVSPKLQENTTDPQTQTGKSPEWCNENLPDISQKGCKHRPPPPRKKLTLEELKHCAEIPSYSQPPECKQQ